jgi:Restriction Enzyme Adenine Methylase Associated
VTTPEDDRLPVTVLIPDSVAAAIEIYEQSAALRVAIVERVGVGALGADWDRPGLYILLDHHSTDGLWASYVGKAPAGIRARLLQHVSHKDHWSRAVLIQRDTTHGFNSAQVAWLEGRVYDLLSAAQNATLHNRNRPGDETLPAFERTALEASIEPIVRVLRLVGFDTSTPEEQPSLAQKVKTSTFHGVTVQEVMAAGLLTSGDQLTSTNGAWPAVGHIDDTGNVVYQGTTYPSPSAAGSAVKGGKATNGWDFWAVETATGLVRLSTLRARHLETK